MSNDHHDCGGCSSTGCAAKQAGRGESPEEFEDRQRLTQRLCRIKHKVIVLSGKGGVGKTTVAANLALSLADKGNRTGLMDVDIHGPSIPRIMGIEGRPVEILDKQLLPITAAPNLKVMSIGVLLQAKDEAVIWRGPLKMGVIKQFLRDVEWGDLDYLVVDSPPGTGDEPLSVIQLIPDLDGAVIVTTPQDLSINDVRRSIQFCRTVRIPVLGVIENMSGFICPHCGKQTDIFKTGGGEKMALDMDVPFLGAIPLDQRIALASDEGKPYFKTFKNSETGRAFAQAIDALIEKVEKKG